MTQPQAQKRDENASVQRRNEAPARLIVVADTPEELLKSFIDRSERLATQIRAGLGDGTTASVDATTDGVPLTVALGNATVVLYIAYILGQDASSLEALAAASGGFDTEVRISVIRDGIELATAQNITPYEAFELAGWSFDYEAADRVARQQYENYLNAQIAAMFGVKIGDDGDTGTGSIAAC